MSRKAKNLKLTAHYLASRIDGLAQQGWPKPKWIIFCETVISHGLSAQLYEARKTVSKYITVRDKRGRSFKVRFSNHRPNSVREENGDCDFFVGVANKTVTTTEQAIAATLKHFEIGEAA